MNACKPESIVSLMPLSTPQLTRVFKCSACDYTNLKKYFVVRHMKSHSDNRPHVCQVCHKAFRTKKYLRNHVNVHTGEEVYVKKMLFTI